MKVKIFAENLMTEESIQQITDKINEFCQSHNIDLEKIKWLQSSSGTGAGSHYGQSGNHCVALTAIIFYNDPNG